MKTVEMVELVLENGESYEFNASNCSVEMNEIVEKKMVLSGDIFNRKTVNKLEIFISSLEGERVDFNEIVSGKNILQVFLHSEFEYESYLVNWCDGDVDENSYQGAYIDLTGALHISIGEDDRT